jgi:hypothetical protein
MSEKFKTIKTRICDGCKVLTEISTDFPMYVVRDQMNGISYLICKTCNASRIKDYEKNGWR